MPHLDGLRFRFENALSVFMVPATTGLVATVLAFGLLAALLSSPMPVQANAADVPLVLATEPVLQQTNFGFTLGAITPDSLVIEAYVDANGRVQDYRILSKPDELADLPHPVKNMLIFTTFRPAIVITDLAGYAAAGNRCPLLLQNQREGLAAARRTSQLHLGYIKSTKELRTSIESNTSSHSDTAVCFWSSAELYSCFRV